MLGGIPERALEAGAEAVRTVTMRQNGVERDPERVLGKVGNREQQILRDSVRTAGRDGEKGDVTSRKAGKRWKQDSAVWDHLGYCQVELQITQEWPYDRHGENEHSP